MKKETSQNFKDQNEYNFTHNLSHDLVWIELQIRHYSNMNGRIILKSKIKPDELN